MFTLKTSTYSVPFGFFGGGALGHLLEERHDIPHNSLCMTIPLASTTMTDFCPLLRWFNGECDVKSSKSIGVFFWSLVIPSTASGGKLFSPGSFVMSIVYPI